MSTPGTLDLEFAPPNAAAGFRLERLEVYNWGTFNGRVWTLQANSQNALLTGDIGSGKSTLVDAITTLLVAPQRLAYNKAAGADARERSLKSYVRGHFKSERSELGNATPVSLRDEKSYSVILAVFRNASFAKTLTLAQVFWFADPGSPPHRLYALSERALNITPDFSDFGHDINALRKRLRRSGVELFDAYPAYAALFRRHFGIESEQALELFHQTVSMKSVGNLTEFVRGHMLEPFDVQPRLQALIAHFDDLNRAHEAVLKAKRQLSLLTPMIDDCERELELRESSSELRAARDALKTWFASLKHTLLGSRIDDLRVQLANQSDEIGRFEEIKRQDQARHFALLRSINDAGGDRLERLREDIRRLEVERAQRLSKAQRFAELVTLLQLKASTSLAPFNAQRRQFETLNTQARSREAELDNGLTEQRVAFAMARDTVKKTDDELRSLRARRSNLPSEQIALRDCLCAALGVTEDAMPFAGELIQVRPDEAVWEGAVERYVRAFGLSLLVPDALYLEVAHYVDRTHLSARLVYFRVRQSARHDAESPTRDALARKLMVKPDSPYLSWLEREIAQRFAQVECAATPEQFRRANRAITLNGQIKAPGERHEKDDRHRIGDRSRYVLGWSNAAKILNLEARLAEQQSAAHAIAQTLGALQAELSTLKTRLDTLTKLAEYTDFREIDWQAIVLSIDALSRERQELEDASDVLKTLNAQIDKVKLAIEQTESRLDQHKGKRARVEQRFSDTEAALGEAKQLLNDPLNAGHALAFDPLERLQIEAGLSADPLTLDAAEQREARLRAWLQGQIDAVAAKSARLQEKIVRAMSEYIDAYRQETLELDASVASFAEFKQRHALLQSDDLPRFELRFKTLLNENTIREVANFQSQLYREREEIKARVGQINRSLTQIDYNPGRFIVLEARLTPDVDVKSFQSELRGCTEDVHGGDAAQDEQYSEQKFIEVKRIIERFRGRDGQAEADRRWTAKVTDVRNWFQFAASERWREDLSEHEHYSDSGGKSGGQKEKLAYTILAASLAYQFGLEWGTERSRTFRFVVIDEAFGRGSDDSARYGLKLFEQLKLQLLVVTPLQKIHIIEPFVASVGFVHNEGGSDSRLRNLSIAEYRDEKARATLSP